MWSWRVVVEKCVWSGNHVAKFLESFWTFEHVPKKLKLRLWGMSLIFENAWTSASNLDLMCMKLCIHWGEVPWIMIYFDGSLQIRCKGDGKERNYKLFATSSPARWN